MQKKISVIMGVHNQKDRRALQQAITSILQQTYKNFEFLIYDDGSCEEEAVFLQKLVNQDERMLLIRGDANLGLAHALNQCIKIVTGDYIARMDADDISAPERLQIQLDFLEEHPQYAFVGCEAKLFDKKGIWGYRHYVTQPTEKEFVKFSPYMHPTVMFRKEVFQKSGGYLETKETRRCEDYELFMRLYSMGHVGYNINRPLFLYWEDREWYDKRTFVQRIAEMKIRYRGFKMMGILNVKNMIYVIKPLGMLLIPKAFRLAYRRKNN